MIVKTEIEIHKNSIDYVKRTFEQYEVVDKLNKILVDPIIHMYPKEDTFDSEGNLNGYTDALFFEADIYDVERMVVCKGKRLHDGILAFGSNISFSQLKIFKDLSTMIVLNGSYTIGVSHQAIDIYPSIFA